MEKRKFTELGLSPEILKSVDKMGFEEASPIQTAVIPLILAGKDVVGQSSTGSGKTCAFAIPSVEKIDPAVRAVQVLILCPTRELALQVAEESAKLAYFKKGVRELPIFGGQSYDRQFRGLAAGAQLVIGTPGRILDHLDRGTLKLDALKVLILDEADRMLDMGFRDDIEKVLQAAPEKKQLLFFSATMPPAIRAMIKRYSVEPEWVKIEALAANAPQVEQIYFEVDRRSKVEALCRLIDVHDFRYGIIFCSTKLMVDELDASLHARGYATDRIHGDIPQAQRNRVLDRFRRREFEFLIATDVAARGIDVDELEVVFNYDLPNDAEDYTHRIGRTGRAGKTGMAFTFVSGQEIYKLQFMVRVGRLKIRRERIPSLDEVAEARDNAFFERVRATLESGQFQKHDALVDRLLDGGFASTDIASALIHLLKNGGLANAPEPTGEAGATPGAGAAPRAAAEPGRDPRDFPERRAAEDFPPRERDFGRRDDFDGPRGGPGRGGKRFDREPRAEPSFAPREARTGKEPGFVPIAFNVGRVHGVSPGDFVGKIAGVTRLPGSVVGAIDLLDQESHVDVRAEHADLVVEKLRGVRMRAVELTPKRLG